MGQLQGEPPDFAGLFANPSIKRMLNELDDHQFEHFVMHVFGQAGYIVKDVAGAKGPGLDSELYTGSLPSPIIYAGVQVKQYTSEMVGAPRVTELRGGVAGQETALPAKKISGHGTKFLQPGGV